MEENKDVAVDETPTAAEKEEKVLKDAGKSTSIEDGIYKVDLSKPPKEETDAVQKQQAITESKAQLAQVEAQLDSQKLEKEAEIKMMLMQKEFEFNMQLKDADLNVIKDKEKYKEDRKDERTKIQASQQSELIQQRKNNTPPKKFESAGFDTLGGFGLEQFEPK